MKRRTEIWIETERAFVQTQSVIQKQWCLQCVAPSIMLTIGEAATFLNTNPLSIYRLIDRGTIHFTGSESTGMMTCVHTLWTTDTAKQDYDAALKLTGASSV